MNSNSIQKSDQSPNFVLSLQNISQQPAKSLIQHFAFPSVKKRPTDKIKRPVLRLQKSYIIEKTT